MTLTSESGHHQSQGGNTCGGRVPVRRMNIVSSSPGNHRRATTTKAHRRPSNLTWKSALVATVTPAANAWMARARPGWRPQCGRVRWAGLAFHPGCDAQNRHLNLNLDVPTMPMRHSSGFGSCAFRKHLSLIPVRSEPIHAARARRASFYVVII